MYAGKRKTKSEVDGQHQEWRDNQVRFGVRRLPRQEKMREDATAL